MSTSVQVPPAPAQPTRQPAENEGIYGLELPAFAAFWLIFSMVFLNSADFAGASNTAESFEFKYQIYLRLLNCGLAGLFGLFYIGSVIRRYKEFPTVLLLLYGFVVLITLPNSIDFTYSLVSAICLMTAVFFMPAALDKLSKDAFITSMFLGTASYVIVSWILYIFFPEIGVWREFLDNDNAIDRMSGLGHPNNLGYAIAGSMILLNVLWRRGRVDGRVVAIWAVVWLATSYACLSRTSFALSFVGVVAINADRLLSLKVLKPALAVGLLAGFGVLYLASTGELELMIDDALTGASKSGDSEELTSLTGRSEIWKHAIEQIGDQLLLGYGYGSQRFVMEEHHFHCHNMVINAALGTGIFAGFAMLGMLIFVAYRFISESDYFIRGMAPIFLIGGLIESLVYTPAPSFEIISFFALILWLPKDQENDVEEPVSAPASD